jgi:hypothetical protein
MNEKKLRNIILIAITIMSTLMHLTHSNKDLMSINIWRQTQTQYTIYQLSMKRGDEHCSSIY